MASQFVGLHMRVVLRDPVDYQLTGTVRDVEAGSSLTLTNVFVSATKEWLPLMRINAANIADLSEVTGDGPLPQQQQQQQQQQPPATYAAPPIESAAAPFYAQSPSQPSAPAPPQIPFIDPAILSLGRRPISASSGKNSVSGKSGSQTDTTAQPGKSPGIRTVRQPPDSSCDEEALEDMVNTIKIGDDGAPETPNGRSVPNKGGPAPAVQKPKKKSRRQPKPQKTQSADYDANSAENSHKGHGKGWRQTPILQSTASFQPFASLKRAGKNGKSLLDNGWASEDVTEEMGDFDFENNLAKFDKRTIFDQMRKEDQVDDASRLVSHNRRVKPGTAGGKNLHYTEMVLDVPSTLKTQSTDFWNSEADVGVEESERLSGREARNGSQSARRADSKNRASRRSQSRKSSAVAVGGQPLSRVNSNVRQYQASRRSSPNMGHRSTDYEQQQQRTPGLYLVPSNRRLETISTLQMLNLENIAANEIGFSEGLMAENAGRGIAEVAVTALRDPAMKVRFELAVQGSAGETSVSSSTIVILAGNNKSSIRALAASRHLRNKNFDVVVCLVGIEREKDLLEDLRRQIQLYRNFGGKVYSKSDFFEFLRKGSETAAGGLSISLIIDALLGLTMTFEELRIGDQASVYELMEWANRNDAFVLSVDVPSGIDPTNGNVAIIDGGHLFVKPRYVVAIGAPKKGLLEAVRPPLDDDPAPSATAHDDGWRLFLVDLGLGSAMWRKAGSKIRRGIEFDGKWVLEMKYRGAEDDLDDDLNE